MVKVKGLSGMWDVAFDPTVKGEVRHIYGHEQFREGDLHGVYCQVARRKRIHGMRSDGQKIAKNRSTVGNESGGERQVANSRWWLQKVNDCPRGELW